jgi:2-polyprenyl-3-methyl-5-hydroxy-6-metoxy-1,4-benzoquinol methylase
MIACKVCGNDKENLVYKVREMQLGLREEFEYQKCSNCGCMQLLNIPANFNKYYPNENYYSFNTRTDIPKTNSIRRLKTEYLLYGKHPIFGRLLSIGYRIPEYYEWVNVPHVKFNDAILDVGCGDGSLLMNLFKIGFTNLTGIDPFINNEKHFNHVNILKKDIFEINEKYDFIMLHHAFEHMDEPLKVLSRLKELLNPGKYILIRIPLMEMYGWKTYNTDWVGLDAPRHIIIHTLKSMDILSKQAGLKIKKVVFDSVPYHIWASEQYKKNIPLMAANSHMVNRHGSLFSEGDIKKFKVITDKSNEEMQGDQAAFYLYNP